MASSPHGVLIVDKPKGPTSHDIVSQVRRVYSTRAVGHAGTLDPLATGVLVVLLGEATKLSAWLTLASKRYQTRIRFGVSSDTLDAAGVLTPIEPPPAAPAASAVERALEIERQRTSQVPPLVSAIRVAGERAHAVARRGETLELAPREVRLSELSVVAASGDELELTLTASKGYYVRALARDLAETLGTAAYLLELRRLASGPFLVDEAAAWPPSGVPALISVTEAACRSLVAAHLTADGFERAACGKALDGTCFAQPPPPHPLEPSAADPPVAWLYAGALVALGRADAESSPDATLFRVVRGFDPALTGSLAH